MVDVTEDQTDERFCWIVILRKHGKVYTYIRTIESMQQEVRRFRERNGGVDPHRMWAIVEDEIRKVNID